MPLSLAVSTTWTVADPSGSRTTSLAGEKLIIWLELTRLSARGVSTRLRSSRDSSVACPTSTAPKSSRSGVARNGGPMANSSLSKSCSVSRFITTTV